MKNAWSLFLGRVISAREALLARASMRPVCPRCGELVHIVRRTAAPHFSHWPQTPQSPACPERVESSGGATSRGAWSGPPREERQHESEALRRALLETHGLREPEAPDKATEALLGEVALLLQSTWRERGRVFPQAAEAVVRDALRAPDLEPASLRQDAHRQLALRLWQHLHLPQVQDDLNFLLLLALGPAGASQQELQRSSGNLTAFVGFVDRLIASALRLLALVPWTELQTGFEPEPPPARPAEPEPTAPIGSCDDCGESLLAGEAGYCERCEVQLCAEHAKQHARWLCPDCGQRPCDTRATGPFDECWVCNEWVCSECFNPCPSCSESICDDCFHDRWDCEGCGSEFCENLSEEVEKHECPACENLYCDRCLDELLPCAHCGEEICRSCAETGPLGAEVCVECAFLDD